MKGSYRRHRSAGRDLFENFRHIARQGGMRAARRFLAESETTFQRLASLPSLGTAFAPGDPRFAGLRYFPLSRFKSHVVFYRTVPDGVEILRVLHGSRDLESLFLTDLDDEEPPETE